MGLLGYNNADLVNKGGIHTATEISGQPMLWMKTFEKFEKEKKLIFGFLEEVIPRVGMVILTGAGTSAFIGISLKGSWSRFIHPNTQVIATTDLVTHPLDFISPETPLLLVSFARSGNSPESVAALKLADKISKSCYHLIITCDAQGELARYSSSSLKCVFLLPEQSNDLGLAMTGSYTGMLLSGLLISNLFNPEFRKFQIERICKYGNRILNDFSPPLQHVASLSFKRAVFIGSGPLFGTATESHLKLQELTDGKIVCKNDSYLGIRHGPKAVIDEGTLLVYLLSNDPYVHKYEYDLLNSMKKGPKALYTIAVSEKPVTDTTSDLNIFLSEDSDAVDEEFLTVCDILPAQLLGFYKSISLGLKPDSPSVSGSISRVVEGVKIYNYQ
jgi:tagatose-6-phosphate ketose/aldose isomerase